MKKNGNISLNVCMLSAVFGAIIFIAIYGISILDITNVDWIRNAGGDLTQSYYGWRFFRASEWHWPLGDGKYCISRINLNNLCGFYSII